MTYEEIVNDARQAVKRIDTSAIGEHSSIEIDIMGEGEGAFYIELDHGKAVVEPFEYYDCDCRIRTNAGTFSVLLSGMLDAFSALSDGSINVEGNIEKVMILTNLLRG